MKAKELEKYFMKKTLQDIELNPLGVAERQEFNKREFPGDKDYRERAIECCLAAKLEFRSTTNSAYNLFQKLIMIKCPYCQGKMTLETGSGNGTSQTGNWWCKCGAKVSLTIPSDGIACDPGEKHERD